MSQTLAIIKPDAVGSGKAGKSPRPSRERRLLGEGDETYDVSNRQRRRARSTRCTRDARSTTSSWSS